MNMHLEPELVATWYDRHLYRYFIQQFGFETDTGRATGRVVAQYPSDWEHLFGMPLRKASEALPPN